MSGSVPEEYGGVGGDMGFDFQSPFMSNPKLETPAGVMEFNL